MMRLIDADALMLGMGVADAVKYGNKTTEQQHNSYSTLMKYEIADYIEDAPTIEAEPVRHGKWIDGRPYTNSRWKVCSVCHKSATHPCGGDNFCPECGAKMELEE